MKKLISILLALIICISLCACGSSMTKEEMFSQAEEINPSDIISTLEENLVKGKETYDGKVVKFTDFLVSDIEDWGFESYYKVNYTLTTSVYLSKEDILNLKTNDCVTVVGVLKVVSETDIELKNAYIV